MELTTREAHCDGMLRRVTAVLLWTYFAWYLGALLAHASGLPGTVGPLAGASMALFALYGWHRHRKIPRPVAAKRFQLSR
jgi:membrane associated rhomboid family serine protease